MSVINVPTKPPRGVKHAKETSGLLMSVISTLSASETNEQRDRERSKLESEYKRCDAKLDELISTHDGDLSKVMQLFTTLSVEVNASREKIHAIKENLHACKTLLGCRRDELLKLWLEGVEHKHMLQLLEEIEQMNEVPAQLNSYLQKKHYLHATKLLVNAVSLGKSTLEGVEALRELAGVLELKKKQLHVKLIEELSRHLYLRSSQEGFQFRRQGSGRDPALLASPFQREAELRASSRRKNESKVKRTLLDVSNSSDQNRAENVKQYEIIENLQGDPEADSDHFMAILVECLALLEKIPETVEKIKSNIQFELKTIIKHTTKEIIDMNAAQGTNQNNLLLELLETIFIQFRYVSKSHDCLLKHLTRAVKHHRIDVRLYEKSTFWLELQTVLQTLLTSYLDIPNIAVDQIQSNEFSDTTEISNYFSRRKNQPRKKGSLFTFETSSNVLNNYLNETIIGQVGNKDEQFVCTPDPNHIIAIFIPLIKFVKEIEQILGSSSSQNTLTLKRFISDYVTDVYLNRIKKKITNEIDMAVRTSDAWKIVISPDVMSDLNVTKPLLQSAITVGNCMREWQLLMDNLPPYASRIAQAALHDLQSYRDICRDAYQGIVQPHTEDKRICSAAWLNDEDISRFLKSLPNWINLKAQRHIEGASRGKRTGAGAGNVPDHADEESPADIHQRNVREADILISNLREGGINSYEIISDMGSLKCLAQLQESMEWFSDVVKTFNDKLKTEPTVTDYDDLSIEHSDVEGIVKLLNTLSLDFDEQADTSLLLLHLEVRVQCFHYLLSKPDSNGGFGSRNNDIMSTRVMSQEPDPKVQQLARVLSAMDEAMNSSLQPHKCKYIFEGLGHLISKILISSSQFMSKINDSGIEMMLRNIFILQQTLTNITMSREIALDQARHYFELFYLSPEEILANVMEKGPEFSELDYMNAFQLINRSNSDKMQGSSVNIHLERLSEILGEVGVTV